MLRNYLKTAWRNLWKNKTFSFVNIFGLSSGLACCILIFLFIQNELAFDKFNIKGENIYRVTSMSQSTAGKSKMAVTPAPWAPLMKKDFPEIKEYVRLLKDEKAVIGEPGQQHFYEKDLLYADSTFFNVFTVSLESGDVMHALEKPNSIVLSNEAALKYFGRASPIGKTLEVTSFGRTFEVEVTAVAKPLPPSSHFHFNSLISLQTLGDISGMWSFHMFQSYLLLNGGAVANALETKLPSFVNKYIINNPQADGAADIYLQPLSDIHLHSHMIGEIGANGDITYIYVFTGVAIFILLIACFNFTNLTTARSLGRAKEVGLRKVVGAAKRQLLWQFLSETVLFALIALAIAIGLAYLALPVFNNLSGRVLRIDPGHNYGLIMLLVLLVTGVGLVAGLYPAVILSAFKPIEVIKGKVIKGRKDVSFRRVLVTLQFAVSIALIASTILVNQQLHFLENKNLGYDKENVMVVTLPRNSDSSTIQSIESELLNDRSITSIATASTIPNDQVPVNQVNDGNADLTKALSMQMLFTDAGFVRTMKMQIVAGHDFNKEISTDKTSGFIINEEAVKKFGWKNPSDAVNKTIQWVLPDQVLKTGKVIGVVKDFNITPLRLAVQPLVMHFTPRAYQYLYIRFNELSGKQILATVHKVFGSFYPKQTFEYSFLDDELNSLYDSERRLGTIFTYFSLLAIVIACLGILGLSLYSIQQRVREIGIRKVLGASVLGVAVQLVKEFLTPVLIGALLATPIAWYGMHKWLEDFAYRIHVTGWVFLITTVAVLILAVVTMGAQSVKAAVANPVKSLRNE